MLERIALHMHNTYYHTLGIKQEASEEEIKRAYRRLAFQYHPDHNDNAHDQQYFIKIKEAYEILSDPHKRNRYDSQLVAEQEWEKKYQERGFNPNGSVINHSDAQRPDYRNPYKNYFYAKRRAKEEQLPKWFIPAAKYLKYISYLTYCIIILTFLDAFLPQRGRSEILLRVQPDHNQFYLLTKQDMYKVKYVENLPRRGDTLNILSTPILKQPDKINFEDAIGKIELEVLNYYHLGFAFLGVLAFAGIFIHYQNKDWVLIFCLGIFHVLMLSIWLGLFF